MGAKDILEKALKLKPQDKLTVVEGLLKSLTSRIKTSTKSGRKKPRSVSMHIGEGAWRIPMEEIFSEE